MKCVYKVLCPLFAAIGIFVGTMYVSRYPEPMQDWLFVAYALIGFAVGGVIAGLLTKCCKKCDCGCACCSKGKCNTENMTKEGCEKKSCG